MFLSQYCIIDNVNNTEWIIGRVEHNVISLGDAIDIFYILNPFLIVLFKETCLVVLLSSRLVIISCIYCIVSFGGPYI